MGKYAVGIVGATGMVGQRFVKLLEDHPWFEIKALAASKRSADKTYAQAVAGRWAFDFDIPAAVRDMPVLDGSDIDAVAEPVDFIFCAVDMPKDETRALEDAYCLREVPVISNNSAHRHTPDVPMMVPEINDAHMAVIEAQRRRLGTARGFVACKPNCSIQGYVPAISALLEFEPEKIMVCTYQAISGAGKTFKTWPEMIDNVVPFIGGEEQKSEWEPLKIWGAVRGGVVVDARAPIISAQCYRVAASDGHMAAVSVAFKKKPSRAQILERWENYAGRPQKLRLPSAPEKFLTYFEAEDRPQTRLDRDLYGGMGVSIGRLREDPILDWKFTSLSHNTLRGAAGGAVLTAEMLAKDGYIVHK
jgi:aspartate-semialdehyde dehydrogenase